MMSLQSESPFPAVIIGGPPHSGKSVFVYSLTRALRLLQVPHYVLRACPDGEGDWANEADQQLVREIRSKGQFTDPFMAAVADQLQRRHLPLLVDVGGRPTPTQESVFAHCTHTILVIGDRPEEPAAYVRDLAAWQVIMARQNVTVLAVLQSQLSGTPAVTQGTDPLTGTIIGLERGQIVTGPVVAAVAERLQALFNFDEESLTRLHLEKAPVPTVVSLPHLAQQLGAADGRWEVTMLPALSPVVPSGTPLAIYGRGPNWLYGRLAVQTLPADLWLFDARLGWIQPPNLPLLPSLRPETKMQAGWSVSLAQRGNMDILTMDTSSQHLSLEQPDMLPLLRPSADRGLILSGKVPNWLLASAIRQLAPVARWTAVFQPPLGAGVVVATTDPEIDIGALCHLPTS